LHEEEALMPEQQTVEREITVPVPAEEAWELVTERRHLEQWLAPEVEIEVRDGGGVRVVGDDGVERTGTVELVEAPNRLRFTWETDEEGPTIVEISVSPIEDGSRIGIVEREPLRIEAAGRNVVELPVVRHEPMLLAA
jgi:uncharacterized protein YndB with AHSA1/START domain